MDAIDWELFKIQTIRAAGLEGHPKAEELYAWCWERYGDVGRDEVLNALCDLAEIELEQA
jgi:hypothetical protein